MSDPSPHRIGAAPASLKRRHDFFCESCSAGHPRPFVDDLFCECCQAGHTLSPMTEGDILPAQYYHLVRVEELLHVWRWISPEDNTIGSGGGGGGGGAVQDEEEPQPGATTGAVVGPTPAQSPYLAPLDQSLGISQKMERLTIGPPAQPHPVPVDQHVFTKEEKMEWLTIGPPTKIHRRQTATPTPQPQPSSDGSSSICVLGCKLQPNVPPAPPKSSSSSSSSSSLPSCSSSKQAAAGARAGPISKVLIIIAMQEEVMQLVQKFNLVEVPTHESRFPSAAPWTRYQGNYKGLHIDIVSPGRDAVFGVDCVRTLLSAALVTSVSIQILKPNIIVNAGTAVGFKAQGASIGDIFLASDVESHDWRIPMPVFDMYGNRQKTFIAPNMVKELSLKVGKLSTGNYQDKSPQDEQMILRNECTIKDMEGAAVAFSADLFSTPVLFVKAVTEIVDGEKPTLEEFLHNLTAVPAALDLTITNVVDFISGKCISDL